MSEGVWHVKQEKHLYQIKSASIHSIPTKTSTLLSAGERGMNKKNMVWEPPDYNSSYHVLTAYYTRPWTCIVSLNPRSNP